MILIMNVENEVYVVTFDNFKAIQTVLDTNYYSQSFSKQINMFSIKEMCMVFSVESMVEIIFS